MVLTSEKKINEQMLFDNAPVESDDYETEAQILDAQVKKQDVTNIGVVATYGAGKSSAINTYLKRYRKKGLRKPKHVQISLADFNKDENDANPDNNNYSENAIERSILQQLFYSQRKYKLPKSSINRTNKTSFWLTAGCALLSIIFILSVIVLSFEISGNSLFNVSNSSIINTIASCVATISLVVTIICLARFGYLKKVKYKDLEIAIDEKGNVPKDYSLFNNFVNEVLYFFECINVDLVIFEDLDRLENLKIFVKLRELNTIINNSPRKANKVTFIYAVKDSMFKDENQRAKFFEFILPIIPVMNPVTTFDNIDYMHKQLVALDSSLKLSEQFLKDISFYVFDMRVLKNTFNDYVIMVKKLSENSDNKLPLKRENLFALALYKNLYPYDYSRLQRNEGLIPLCVDKDKLIKYYETDVLNQINELENEKKRIDDESLKNFNELKLLFKGQHLSYSSIYSHGVQSVDSITSFKDIKLLQHPRDGYAVQVQNLPNGESYYERERIIKGKAKERIAEIDNEIRECKSKMEEIENNTFNSLLNKFGIEKYFSVENLAKIKVEYKEIIANELFKGQKKENLLNDKKEIKFNLQLDFIRMLINKNYLDENYLEYTSNNKSELSLNDREFIRNVKQGYVKTYNYKLDNVNSVIINLNEEDFIQPAILIKDICLSLSKIQQLDSNNINANKFKNIMNLLATGSKLVVRAVTEFLNVSKSDEKIIFAGYIVKYSSGLIEPLFLKDISKVDRDIFVNILIRNNKYDVLKKRTIKTYIEEHSKYLQHFSGVEIVEICKIIERLSLHFNLIDLTNGKDEVYKYIVKSGFYNLTLDNLKIILDINESNKLDFAEKNFSFIKDSGNENLIKKINNYLSDYLNNVYVKLPNSKEAEGVFKAFILNKSLDKETKSKLIKHSKVKIENLKDIDEQLYEDLLLANKIKSSWTSIFTVYRTGKYRDLLNEFISLNDGKINGSYAKQDRNLQIEVFNNLLTANYSDEIYLNLAKSIDVQFTMTSAYANNTNCEQFVLNDCFVYSIRDMSLLSNTHNMLPYLICHQDEILKTMSQFFSGHTFEASYMEAIIDNKNLSIEFKKEFVFVCGGSLVDLVDIEVKLALFISDNNCNITERLLFKFIGANIDESLKIGILFLAVEQGIITNSNNFMKYFQSISDEYAGLWKETKKAVIEDNSKTRSIAEYMKEKDIATYTPRKGKLYLRCS